MNEEPEKGAQMHAEGSSECDADNRLLGECECGAVRYRVADAFLVDAPAIHPTKHIFVGSKAPWFEITDNLPQFEEYPT